MKPPVPVTPAAMPVSAPPASVFRTPAATALDDRRQRRKACGIGRHLWIGLGFGLVALTGCGTAADVNGIVARAGAATIANGTAEVTMVGSYPPLDGRPAQTIEMSGVIDFERALASFKTTAPVAGIRALSHGAVAYFEIPGPFILRAGGAHWTVLDPGLDPTQADPTGSLDELDTAEAVTKVGDEILDGVPVTHFRGEYTFPGGGEDTRIPFDVWIDGEGRAQRLQETIDYSKLEFAKTMAVPAGDTVITMSFSNFGVPVDITVPDAADTIPFSEFQKLVGN